MNNLVFHKAMISDVIQESPTVRRFVLTYEQLIQFKPGQFVILKFEGLNHQFDTRSYSIAGQVDAHSIELCVVYKEDGAATPLLFECKKGDMLLSSLPEGRFVLPDEPIDKNLFFICTGTGVAPFRCMIKELLHEKNHTKAIHLFFGCRNKEDLLYQAEFEMLEKTFPNFKYYPVLSRGEWEGLTGYVHPHYLKVLETTSNALFYLCGWTEMLKQTRDNIKNLGYTRQDIKVEFYD